MAINRCVIILAMLAGVAAQPGEMEGATPMSKVTDLIEGLKKEVEEEGVAEAASYNKFSCFCKDETMKKSESVEKGQLNIDELSATIEEKTAERESLKKDIVELTQLHEKLAKELEEAESVFAKETAAFEAEDADLSKAVSSLQNAKKALEDSQPNALVQLKSVVATLRASGLASTPKAQKATLLLQQKVDPEQADYQFHSQEIVELITHLLEEFTSKKTELETEYAKTKKAAEELIAAKKEEMKVAKETKEEKTKQLAEAKEKIAQAREDLIEAQSDMKDDALFLKDLTARCEARAHNYDQRSQMRADEIEALGSALDVLTNSVGDKAEVNKRAAAFLQKHKAAMKKEEAPVAVSFVQEASVKEHSNKFLAVRQSESLELEARKNQALEFLREQSHSLNSLTLASLATRAGADPFAKVKTLIQRLIERLLQESADEATKKGFCDTAVSKAENNRDARFEESMDLSREIGALETKKDELETEIEKLTKEIKDGNKSEEEAEEERKEEKENNLEAIKTAKEGLKGVEEATMILKTFYKNAAKAGFVQTDASPVDEAMGTQGVSDEGFSTSYAGKQGGMKAVFGLLEVLASDFDRTIRKTQAAEEKAHRDYVEFMQTGKSSVAGKETKKKLDTEDLETTHTKLDQAYLDLKDNVDLTDSALKELQELKPQCIDTGMSYEDRVAAREAEIAALKKALCMLDPEGKEASCGSLM